MDTTVNCKLEVHFKIRVPFRKRVNDIFHHDLLPGCTIYRMFQRIILDFN